MSKWSSNQEALASFRRGFPATFGGFMKDSRGMTKKFASFVMNTPPDITSNTRILAVCGISDEMDDASAPYEDGWFYSDFFAFHTLLYGQGGAQTWFCSDKPADLLQKYGEYVHGSPYSERRVVLNESLLRTELDDINISPATDLLKDFQEALHKEATIAAAENAPLVLFIFGHGLEPTASVEIGRPGNELSIVDVASALGDNVDLTIVSTACYSGGWAVTSQLNATVLAAAGVEDASESWPKSASLSRACGSIYASTLISTLSNELSNDMRPEREASPSSAATGDSSSATMDEENRSKSFAEFARTVHKLLLTRVDRFGYTHNISFSATDDDWECQWRKRTGFPLIDMKTKWESLPTVPACETSPLNRDPTSEFDLPTDAISLSSMRGRHGSTISYVRQLRFLAQSYLASHPGRDSLAPNSSLHQRCHDLISGKRKFDLDTLESIESALRYRMSLNSLANHFVSAFDLPLPSGKVCEEWDPIEKGKYATPHEKDNLNQRLLYLFPQPIPTQGRGWNKPRWYIIAALYEAKLPAEKLEQIVLQLLDASRAIEREQKLELQEHPVIQSKRKRVLKSWSRFVRRASPSKRGERTRSKSPSKREDKA